MKRLLSVIALGLVAVAYAGAQTINPTKYMVMQLDPNEELNYSEYAVQMASSPDKFCCVLENRELHNMTFVMNGERLITADYVHVHYFDLDSYDNCILTWFMRNDDRYLRYIKTSEGTFGPFDYILYLPDAFGYWGQTPYEPSWLLKDSFLGDIGKKVYLHHNGSVLCVDSNGSWDISSSLSSSGMSPNGKYKAWFDENRMLNFNDGVIDFELPEDSYPSAVPMDNGDIYFSFYYVEEGSRLYYVFSPDKDEITQVNVDNKYYDFRTSTIVEKDGVEHHFYGEGSAFLYGSPVMTVTDPTGNHTLSAGYQDSFVTIDGEQYGSAAPIMANYDPSNNSFWWVTQEGDKLFRYVYKIK